MAAWHTDITTGKPNAWILNDNGKGEVADLIVIHLPDSWLDTNGAVAAPHGNLPAGPVKVILCHCKWAGSDSPRRDLDGLDQVVGQAHRSVRWLANPQAFWTTLAERAAGRAKIAAGDPVEVRGILGHLADNTPRTEFSIQIA